MEPADTLPVYTRDILTVVAIATDCPEDHVTELVDKLTYGISDLAQDALGALNALEERWAEEDRLAKLASE